MNNIFKKGSKDLSLTKSILLILLSITIAVGGQVLLKIGLNKIGEMSINSASALGNFFIRIDKL